MSGYYYVGQNKNFVSVSAAILAMASQGISSTTTIKIDSGIYHEQLIFNAITGCNSNNRIIIESTTGRAEDVVISFSNNTIYNNYIVKLNSSGNLIFRNITIKYDGQSNYGRLVEMLNNISNITFDHVVFKASHLSALPQANEVLFKGDHNGIVENLKVISCLFEQGNNPVSITNYPNNSGQISSVEFYGNLFINGCGDIVSLTNFKQVIISNNNFKGNKGYLVQKAINCINVDDSLRITKNQILCDKLNTGIKISGGNYSVSRPGIIANNFVCRNNSMEAIILSATHLNLVFNTIHVSGSTTNANNIYINSYSSDIVLKNNILSNYAGGCLVNAQIINASLVFDYNDYYTTGIYLFKTSNYGSFSSLASWNTILNNDIHSITIDPDYFFPFDMHMRNPLLNNLGIPLQGFSVDIDNQVRSVQTPDMGADEFDPVNKDLALISLRNYSSNTCMGANELLKVRLQNRGMASIDFSQTNCIISGSSQSINPKVFNQKLINQGILPRDSFIELIIANSFDMSSPGIYSFNIQLIMAGDDNVQNNAMNNYHINNSAVSVFPNKVNFEMTDSEDDISWSFNESANYGWSIGSGIITSNAGPVVDHTRGTTFGKYLYIQNSSCVTGQVAEFISPCLHLSQMKNPQLLFYYHMHGSGIGSLAVDVLSNGQWVTNVKTLIGQQQYNSTDAWKKVQIDLSVFLSVEKVKFRAVSGTFSADIIAIDDITIDDAPFLNKSGIIYLCQNDTFMLKVHNGYSCVWKSIPQNQIIGTLPYLLVWNSGKIISEITTQDGVFNRDTVEIVMVSPPVINVTGQEDICAFSPKIITKASTNSYKSLLWSSSGDGSFNSKTAEFPIYTPGILDSQTGSLLLYITTVGKGTCKDIMDSVSVTVLPQPQVDAGLDKNIDCYDSSGVQIGSLPQSNSIYQWIPSIGLSNANIANPVAHPLVPTKYRLKAINNLSGCSNTDTVFVGILNGPQVVITKDTSICYGSPVNLYVQGGSNYHWSNNTISQLNSVTPKYTTTYTVTVTNGSCGNIGSCVVSVLPLPEFDLGNDTILCNNSSITFQVPPDLTAQWNSAGYGNLFTFNTGNTQNIQSVWVDVMDTNGCRNSDTIMIMTEICNSVENSTNHISIKVYPNPASTDINIIIKGFENNNMGIKITDNLGNEIIEKEIFGFERDLTRFDISRLSAGIYYIYIEELNGKFRKTVLFIKE